jgi:hypothetical protein
MKPSLPIAVRWVVRLVVPARSRDQVLSDLEDDYARVHARRRPFAARWWLFRETTSVMASYSAAPFERAGEAWPAWSRDVRLVIRGFRRGGALTAAGAAAMLAVGLLAVLVTAGLSQTLLFRQVSASYGDRLRRVGTVDRDGRTSLSLSFVEVQIIREYLGVAATVSTVNMQPVVIRAGETSVQTMVEVVDGSYFTVIGAAATLGRALLEIDDRPEAMLAVGLLAVLVTAGLSQTLLFRQVSASYGDRLRRVRDRGCRARTRIIELHGRQRRCLGARRSRRSGAQSRMAKRPRQSMVHRVCARDRDERGSRGAPRCRGTGTRENAP